LALIELSLDFNIVDTSLGEKHPAVSRLSPTGTVPVLQDEEVIIWESGIMLDYLDAKYARGSLVPQETFLQVRVRSMHAYSDRCVGPALRDLVFEKRSKPDALWDMSIILEGEQKWRDCQAYLESQLQIEGFFGPVFGAADCALAARCGVAEVYGAGVSSDYPRLEKWYDGVKGKVSWNAAYPTSFIST